LGAIPAAKIAPEAVAVQMIRERTFKKILLDENA
jgi:hypothetical protein